MFKKLKYISQTRLIALSFLLVILSGTFLLTLPIASRDGVWTNPLNASLEFIWSDCNHLFDSDWWIRFHDDHNVAGSFYKATNWIE